MRKLVMLFAAFAIALVPAMAMPPPTTLETPADVMETTALLPQMGCVTAMTFDEATDDDYATNWKPWLQEMEVTPANIDDTRRHNHNGKVNIADHIILNSEETASYEAEEVTLLPIATNAVMAKTTTATWTSYPLRI